MVFPFDEKWLDKKFEEEIKRLTQSEIDNILSLKDKKVKSLKELINEEFQDDEFLVKGLIPKNGISVISGYPGVGKTWFVLFLAKAVAEGSYFINEEFLTSQTGILIVEEENGERELQKRFKKIGANEDAPIYILSQNSIKVDREEDRLFLIEECRRNNIGLIIFDPFISIHNKSENSAEDIQKVMEAFQDFINEGITIIFTHHHRKQLGWTKTAPSQALRGSSVIFGRVDSHLALELKKEDPTGNYLIVLNEKLRNSKKAPPFEIKLYEDGFGVIRLDYLGIFEEEKLKVELCERAIYEYLGQEGEKFRREIIEIFMGEGYGQATIDRAIKNLKEKGLIKNKRVKTDKGTIEAMYYRADADEQTPNEPQTDINLLFY